MEEGERQGQRDKLAGKETGQAAGPSTSSAQDAACSSGGDDTDKTDVCSENFDPLLALYSPTVSLPFPNIKCFNNVAEFESFQRGGRGRAKPENVEKRRQKAMKGVADPERIERLKKLMVKKPANEEEEGESSCKPRRRKQKVQKNVLTRMPLCKGSPLGELYRCVEERVRVRVHIRTFKGFRGVCSGFVVAFDKFWNMAMVDVDETYGEPLLGEAFYHQKALTVTRLFQKLKVQERSRGDEPAAEQQGDESKRQPESAKTSPKSRSAHPTSRRGDVETESKQSDPDKPKQEKPRTDCTYGKVHTRHISQLFIRGESIILVNPEPL
ncbi:U7 snRNA-associated Sm-like protein LSm11 [Aulostomus maculatus]